jgi:hypothetical protein
VAFALLSPLAVVTVIGACACDAGPGAGLGYHGAVSEFKRRLIEATLHQVRGNRTHAARALGLQRTYLLRLIRDLQVAAPPPPPRRIAAGSTPDRALPVRG